MYTFVLPPGKLRYGYLLLMDLGKGDPFLNMAMFGICVKLLGLNRGLP